MDPRDNPEAGAFKPSTNMRRDSRMASSTSGSWRRSRWADVPGRRHLLENRWRGLEEHAIRVNLRLHERNERKRSSSYKVPIEACGNRHIHKHEIKNTCTPHLDLC